MSAFLTTVAVGLVNPSLFEGDPPSWQVVTFGLTWLLAFAFWELAAWLSRDWLVRDWLGHRRDGANH